MLVPAPTRSEWWLGLRRNPGMPSRSGARLGQAFVVSGALMFLTQGNLHVWSSVFKGNRYLLY